ncbi:MAG: M1 family metallopeptidase [Candidatus Micrarchaeia archaeon]
MNTEMHETIGKNVIPAEYRLKIETNMKDFVFEGFEEVDVSIAKSTDTIIMNAKELVIRKAEITSNSTLYEAKVEADKKNELIALHINKRISGSATIRMAFTGINNDRMYGFYRSRYHNSKTGRDEYMLTTQFEAADARSAFPCFDEPEFKATFGIEIAVDKGLDAISNMPVGRIIHEKSKDRFVFEKTPKMSTYLVYMGVGKFEYLAGKLGKLPIRVVTVPSKIKYAKLALSLTKKFVAFYEGYFGVEYPLPKLDMIAIPDFAAGAMENWGAITFREIAILGDEKTSSTAILQSIAETLAHELAHQWFGDLVTMQWWNDLWLNESFATFMSFKAMANVFPKWDIDTQAFLETNAIALGADELNATHPISVKVDTPFEIDEIFDEISYEKGGSILKMIEDYVGYDIFRQGLHLYLKKHAYQNATKYDLWGAMNTAAERARKHLNVNGVAQAWIDKSGYPMIELRQARGNFYAIQHRFTLLGSNDKGTWPIPLRYIDRYGKHFEMFNQKSKRIKARGDYVKLNYGQKGFYRARYPDEVLLQLGEMIKLGRLGGLDAWGVENDLYALLISRNIDMEGYLNFVSDYCGNAGYPLNYSISGHISNLFRLFYLQGSVADKIKKVGIPYYNSILSKIGIEKKKGEPNTTTLLRSAAISGLAMMDSGGRVAKRMLGLYKAKLHGKPIDSNLSGIAYSTAAWNGNGETFNELAGLYKKEQLPEEQRKLLSSIGYFRDTKLLNKALNFSISNDVRLQDSFVVSARVSFNPVGERIIWKWTKRNWQVLKGRYDSGTHMLGRYVSALSTIADSKTERDIIRFFSEKSNMRRDINRALKQALEAIKINILLIDHVKQKRR